MMGMSKRRDAAVQGPMGAIDVRNRRPRRSVAGIVGKANYHKRRGRSLNRRTPPVNGPNRQQKRHREIRPVTPANPDPPRTSANKSGTPRAVR
jgi:hypothetical protein